MANLEGKKSSIGWMFTLGWLSLGCLACVCLNTLQLCRAISQQRVVCSWRCCLVYVLRLICSSQKKLAWFNGLLKPLNKPLNTRDELLRHNDYLNHWISHIVADQDFWGKKLVGSRNWLWTVDFGDVCGCCPHFITNEINIDSVKSRLPNCIFLVLS